MKNRHRLLAIFLALTMVLTYMPALAFADSASWNASAGKAELYLPEEGGSVDLTVVLEGEYPPLLYYHWLVLDPEMDDDVFYTDEDGNPVQDDGVTEIPPLTVTEPGTYHCQVRESASEGNEGDWKTVRFDVYDSGDGPSDDPDSWYIGGVDNTEITYDPETDRTVTLDAEVFNADAYDLAYSWISVEYNEDGEPVETVLEGENSTSVTVEAKPGEYKFVVTDAANDREKYVTFFVREGAHSSEYNTDVASIEYTPKNRIEVYENTKGYMYQGEEGTEPYWYYNECNNFANEGDVLHLVYKDGSDETFVYTYDTAQGNRVYKSDQNNYLYDGDLSYEENQYEEPWKLGENHFTVSYEGVSCEVPIYIVPNPVKKIEYTFVNGLELTEHTDGWYDDEDPDFFRYRFEWTEGDVLTVYTDDDPDGKAYTLMQAVTGGSQDLWYEADDGSIIKSDDVRITDNQEEQHWQVGNSYPVTVSYAGQTFTAQVTIKEQVVNYFEDPQEYLLSDSATIEKSQLVVVKSPDGTEFRYFDISDIKSSDSRVKVKHYADEECWVVTATEKGTYTLNVTHQTIDPATGDVTGETTSPMQIIFNDESASVDISRTDSTLMNFPVLPGKAAKLEATGYYYQVYKDSEGNFDTKEITTGLTYKWVFSDEKSSKYATIEGADTSKASVKVREDIDLNVLHREPNITVKAELYYKGAKIAESEDFEFPASDHYYKIEPETWSNYLVPNVKTAFKPKLYKYAYVNGAVTKTDCKADFELEYDTSEFKFTDAKGNPVTDYSKGPFYVTRLKDYECSFSISGSGGDSPYVGHSYYFDYMVNLKKAKVSGIANKTYNGKAQTQKPTVKVYDSGEGRYVTLSSKYYTVSYKNNKNVGKAYVYIKGNNGKSRYYGNVPTQAFKINPLGTKLSKIAAGSRCFSVKWARRTTKMSTSVINGYQIQYSTSSKFTSGNKLVNVKGYKSYYKKFTKLQAKKRYYVRVRTYKAAGGAYYYSPWSSKMYVTTKR